MKQNTGCIDGFEWEYIGEGGKHALFGSHGEDFRGKLLRIEKQNFRAAALWSRREHIEGAELLKRKSRSPLEYLEKFVAPQLAPYVDIPELVPLEWEFLGALRETTLAAGVVPPSRIKDWNPKPGGEGDVIRQPPIGMLVVDYRKIPASMKEQDVQVVPTRRRFCIEVKPKAGYLSRSPLVHPNHRVKLTKSRFALLQELHQQGHVEKGWAKTASGIKRSSYEPLDLFSKDRMRMYHAIESLVESPQNNLKVWYDNQAATKLATFGSNATERVQEDVASYPNSRLDERHAKHNFGSLIADLLVPVLAHETLLGKLQSLQQLDILDVDGAILVSDRLVELCGGSEQEAETIISDWLERAGDQREVHPLLSASPFHIPSKNSTLLRLCQTIEEFRELLSGFDLLLPQAAALDKFYSEARDLVSNLSREECAVLLSSWLLSLAMCDVSIFVTFEQLPRLGKETFQSGVTAGQAEESKSFIAASVDKGSGIVSTNENGTMSRFEYRVRLIDCDQKPPKKLWGRKQKEAAFAELRMEERENNSFIT